MTIVDAWSVFREAWQSQRDLERKKKAFQRLTGRNLNYTFLEELVTAAAKQGPGFYSVITFPDGTKWEFGKKDKPLRVDGETF